MKAIRKARKLLAEIIYPEMAESQIVRIPVLFEGYAFLDTVEGWNILCEDSDLYKMALVEWKKLSASEQKYLMSNIDSGNFTERAKRWREILHAIPGADGYAAMNSVYHTYCKISRIRSNMRMAPCDRL